MSDNDCVSRAAVINIAMQYCPDDDGSCSRADVDMREMLDEIEALPDVPQEMTAGDYLRASYRIHNSVRSCEECPLSHYNNGTGYVCHGFVGTHPAEAVTIVEKWAREHPERSEEKK